METRSIILKKNKKLMFKSYYVVWKPVKYLEIWLNDKSLNRTMQYGNSVPFFIFATAACGLNRTMQYGNDGWTQQLEAKGEGLNRTMQYGNFIFSRWS